jgi:predicted peptidase
MGRWAMQLLAALVTLAPAIAFSQDWTLREGQHRRSFVSKDPANMAGGFLLFLPKGYEQGKWPLVVFLHGRGEVGTDPEQIRNRGGMARLAERNPDLKLIVASPQLAPTATWFDPAALDDFLDQLLARVPMIDPDRVYLSGLSMGAKGVWAWGAASPGRFAAIVPVANRYEPEHGCAFKSLPVWAFHNDRDPVVPVAGAKAIVEAVNACGGSARLTVYPNRDAHDAWNAAYTEPELLEWLLARRRKPGQ